MPRDATRGRRRSSLGASTGKEAVKQSAQMKLEDYPKVEEVLGTIPKHCLKPKTLQSLKYALFSITLTAAVAAAAIKFLPVTFMALPLWIAYAAVEGTIATGIWVVAHECGHGAFSRHAAIETTVGYVLHSLCLVPYFAWQRSHAVHHSRTNHLTEGETHVPDVRVKAEEDVGGPLATAWNVFLHLVVGWPAYLLAGVSGGPVRGTTNHFVPTSRLLFPSRWKAKVWASDVGIAAVLYLLYRVACAKGVAFMLAVYGGPYLVMNAWLVGYTWLHHTGPEIPVLDSSEWSWLRGALCTVDRPYGPLLDLLHHNIGSTHVAHHLCSAIPHYHAREATKSLRKAYPTFYMYDDTPIYRALWEVAKRCRSVTPIKEGSGVFVFQKPKEHAQ